MNLNKDKPLNSSLGGGQKPSSNTSLQSDKADKKFDFIKKNNSNQTKEDTRQTFSFLNKAPVKIEENTTAVIETNPNPSFELQTEVNNNITLNNNTLINLNTSAFQPINSEEKKSKFNFIKKQTNEQVDSVENKQKRDLEANKIINNIYNTSLNFDKQSVRTVDLQNKIFDENLMNELNNSETKSYKSVNPNNQMPNLIPNEVNVSAVENNNEHETSNINFQNLLNSDNFGQQSSPHNTEEPIFKDIQPSSSKFNFIKNKNENNKETGKDKLSFIKKKDISQIESNSNIVTNNPEFVKTIESEGKEPLRRVSAEDFKSPEALKNKCKEEFNRCEENLKDLYLKMHQLKKNLLEKENKKIKLNEDMEALQTKENIAIENNDFDEAQRLENLIENKKDELKNIKHLIKADLDEMIKYREQELFLMNTKIRNTEDVIGSLSKLKNSQNYELETFQNNEVSKHKNDQLKIKKMREKLDIIKVDIDNEKNFLKEEEDKVNNAIKSQSSEVFIELDELKNNKDKLLEEIEELKRQLQLKYNELDNLNKNIESKELEIDAIKSNFSHELNKLSKKTNRFNENKRDFEEQENQYEQMCQNYATSDTKIIDKTNTFLKTISDLESDIAEFKQKQINLNNDVINKESFLKTENEIKSKIYLTQLNIEKIEVQKNKNTEEVQSLEINNKRLESDISVIVLKIPRLEEEKQNFVMTKNFKEAGRVAGDLKSQKEEKEKLTLKSQENKEKISQLKETNAKYDKELEQSIEEKEKEEMELNIVRYQYLLSYKQQIEEIIEKSKSKNSNEAKIFEEELTLLNDEISKLEALNYIKIRFPKLERSIIESVNNDNLNETEEKIKNQEEHTEDDHRENIEETEKKIEEMHEESIPENEYTEEELNEMKNDLKNLINNLEQAQKITLENEDYDKADELQKEIDNLQIKLNALEALVPVARS